MAGGYQYCSSCKRIEKNMTIFICPKCKRPYETVSDDSDMEDKNSNEKWYIRCGSCGAWISFEDKENVPNSCPECYEIGINNVGEDCILSEEEYLLEIGEIKSKNEVAEKDSIPGDKEKKNNSEEVNNIENDEKNQLDTSDSEYISQNDDETEKADETERGNEQKKDNEPETSAKPETVDEPENNTSADDFAPKFYGHEIKSDEHKSEIKEISYIEFINNNDGKVIRIGRGKHILGKLGDVESDYFIEKKYIGRQHAMVVVDQTGAFIEDWNSTNGTRINGEMIYKRQGKMRIVNEDIVTMADQNFEVRICR